MKDEKGKNDVSVKDQEIMNSSICSPMDTG